MRITSLELHNIKSYSEPTRLDLSNGVNAICGPNGSGKTTVLEAIGFALFDYLPYPQAAFLREGQKSGSIRLCLVGRDGREYEVVRRVGSGATHFVADRETGTRIAERKDTLAWIREKALDLDGEAELAALFKNAIGVPQGLMTADFQGAPASRKAIFDPLLRVEEYRQAFEYLLQTVNYLKERSSQLSGEIGVLRSDVVVIPDRESDLAALLERLHLAEDRLARAGAEKQEIDAQVAALDDVERRLRRLESDLAGAEYDVRRFVDRVAAATDALHEAEQAREIVFAAEPGYRLFLAAKERLVQLEMRRTERDGLQAELQGAQAERKGIFEMIQDLDRQRSEAEDAAGAAAGLVEAVSRQTSLEQRQSDVAVRVSTLTQIDARITRLQQEIGRLQRVCEERDVALARARAAEQLASGLSAAQESLEQIVARLGQLDSLRLRQRALREEGSTLRAERDRLAQDVERLTGLRTRLAELEPAAGALDDLVVRQRGIQERQARLAAELAYQDLARRELEQSHCPLLDLQCPAVSTDPELLARLQERDAGLSAQEATVRAEIIEVERQVAAAAALREEVQGLRLEAATLARSEAELPRLEERLDTCRSEYAAVTEQLGAESELKKKRASAQAELQSLQSAARQAAGLALLEEQHELEREALQLQGEELKRLEEECAELGTAESEAAELARELAALEDPRSRQQHLLALAGRKAGIDRLLAEQQERLAEAAGRVKAYVAGLQSFEGLDTDIAAERDREAAHAEDYERFLQHRSLARELEGRTAVLTESQKELDAATERHAALTGERDNVAAGYDTAVHAELRQVAREAGELVVRDRTLLEQLVGEQTRAERELAELRRKAQILRRREEEHGELSVIARAIHFIRETIKAAGPAVTDSLLRNISAGANEIFAEIMDDHAAELRWDRDYEVLVQRGAETRKFPQLSGGEQMSAALAVRLALLKEMSEVDFAFFDEPTQNMDGERRGNLAGQISQVKGFDQLIVISHDDTFEHHTDNLIRLEKQYEETRVAGE